jgi:hypothetical protein
MAKPPPHWQAHAAASSDRDMTARCAALQGEITADRARRYAILTDPRDLHREMFAPFAPSRLGEYAGTYRGAPRSMLTNRRMSSASQLERGADYEFCLPADAPPAAASIIVPAGQVNGSCRLLRTPIELLLYFRDNGAVAASRREERTVGAEGDGQR